MKKTLLLILILVLLTIIFIFIAALSKKTSPIINVPTIPTPSPIVIIRPSPLPISQTTITQSPISIASINPPDNSINVGTNQQITITFTNNVYINDFQILSTPLMDFSLSNQSNTITITPKIPYSFNTKYTFSIKYNNQTTNFSFTTISGTENPNTDNYLHIRDAYLRTSYPDMFLANNVPYENDYFSITSPNSDSAQAQYTFTVSFKKASDVSKNAFLQWLYSLGLTESQINSLQITYQ